MEREVFRVCEGVKEIRVSADQVLLVDAEDYERVKDLAWAVRHTGGFRKPHVKAGNVILARLVLGLTDPAMKVFHRNGNFLDCRKANLQMETQGIVNHRTDKEWPKTSRYRGVHWEADRRKWRAVIYHMGRRVRLGRYDTEIEAARAYDEKARELYGALAHPNLVDAPQAVTARSDTV
jgi:hypothetical protein